MLMTLGNMQDNNKNSPHHSNLNIIPTQLHAPNAKKLDEAMQELIDICQLSLEHVTNDNKNALVHTRDKKNLKNQEFMHKSTNDCDKKENSNIFYHDDSIETLQQRQTELQIQLDEVIEQSKRLELKHKHKLNCIVEDDGGDEDESQIHNEDENELVEFQKIENDLKISEINRQLDKIQEELRIRLYKRLLSNTNSKSNHNSRSRGNRRGSQTDESSPSSSSCSDEQPSYLSVSNDNLTIQVSDLKKDRSQPLSQIANQDEGNSQTKGRSEKMSDNTSEQSNIKKLSIDNTKNDVSNALEYNVRNIAQSHIYNDIAIEDRIASTITQTCNQSFQNYTTLQQGIMITNSSSNNLERIDEDEEDDQDIYNDSNHFRTIYEEKLSPILRAGHLVERNNNRSSESFLRENNRVHSTSYDPTKNYDRVNDSVIIKASCANQSYDDNNSSGYNSCNSKMKETFIAPKEGHQKHNRPLTMYLPNSNQFLDMVEHIQALGHDLNILSDELKIEHTKAHGYLRKSCLNNNKRWLKRYFHLDRTSRTISYFDNDSQIVNNKKKQLSPKGVISFEEITDVYVNHKLSVSTCEDESEKSNKKKYYVFVLATKKRKYLLSARRAEVMRAWVDIFNTAVMNDDYFDELTDQEIVPNDENLHLSLFVEGDLNTVGLSISDGP